MVAILAPRILADYVSLGVTLKCIDARLFMARDLLRCWFGDGGLGRRRRRVREIADRPQKSVEVLG